MNLKLPRGPGSLSGAPLVQRTGGAVTALTRERTARLFHKPISL